ncbi:MAG: hypothetical protein IJH60_02225, partial [Eubacterium sp.]|nr:hypothetical protein [Eubacterium sp.]
MSRTKLLSKCLLTLWILLMAIFFMPAGLKAAEGDEPETYTVIFNPGDGQVTEGYKTELKVPVGGSVVIYNWGIYSYEEGAYESGGYTYDYLNPDAFTKEGWYLESWLDTEGNQIPFDTEYPITGDTEITALWGELCTVTFNPGDGQITEGADNKLKVPKGGYIEVSAGGDVWSYQSNGNYYNYLSSDSFIKEGARLKGWQDAEGSLLDHWSQYPITEDTEYTAKWMNVYTVTLNPGDGQVLDGDTIKLIVPENGWIEIYNNRSVASFKDDSSGSYEYVDSNAFKKEGCYLNGWKNNEGDILSIGERIPVTEDMEITAEWEEAYTVTIEPGDGEVVSDWVKTEYSIPEGGYITISDDGNINFSEKDSEESFDQFYGRNFRKDNSYLKCWKVTEGKELVRGDMFPVTKDMTLTAIWGNACELTLDLDGGNIYIDSDDDLSVPEGGYICCRIDEDKSEGCIYIYDENNQRYDSVYYESLRKDNAYFNGWLDENGVSLDEGENYKITKDTVLTASWVDTIKVTLNPGEGSLKPWFDTAEVSLPEGGIIAISGNGDVYSYGECSHTEMDIDDYYGYISAVYSSYFEREGYYLKGWQDASGKDLKPNRDIRIDEPTTLTAVWGKINKISFDLDGGTIKENYIEEYGTELEVPEKGFIKYEGNYMSSYRENGKYFDEFSCNAFDKEGYIFAGLKDRDGNPLEEDSRIPIDDDTLLTVVWTKAYKVTFDPGEGEVDEGTAVLFIPVGGSIYATNNGIVYSYAAGVEVSEEPEDDALDSIWDYTFHKE